MKDSKLSSKLQRLAEVIEYDPVSPETFKVAMSYASLHPNSINSEANRTMNQSNLRVALAGVADFNAMIINFHKKSE